MNQVLVLFTSSYPYKGGEQFIETEIDYLADAFEKVIIVPSKKNSIKRKLPQNVFVDDFVASADKSMLMRVGALFSKEFIRYINLNLEYNKYWAINVFYVLKYQEWIEKFIKKDDAKQVVFYSYWFGASTSALSFIKKKNIDIKYCTRVHRGDLYEYIHGFNHFPARQDVVKNIDKIFSISENGKKHMIQNYTIDSNKIEISRLGINPHGLLSSKSKDDVLRVVSCSSLIDVKRVHLIVEALEILNNKKINIDWTHIGDGPLMQEIQKLAKDSLSDNIQFTFIGFVTNEQIYDYYSKNFVDVFINVSSSEGVPVSIMEAQSFSIPCIATDVGGNSEIVNDENGFLLCENPKADDIASVFTDCFNNQSKWLVKSKLSLNNWNKKYNAKDNYNNFTDSLMRL